VDVLPTFLLGGGGGGRLAGFTVVEIGCKRFSFFALSFYCQPTTFFLSDLGVFFWWDREAGQFSVGAGDWFCGLRLGRGRVGLGFCAGIGGGVAFGGGGVLVIG